MEWTVLDRFGGDADGDARLDEVGPGVAADLDVFTVRVSPSAAVCADLDTALWRVDSHSAEVKLESGGAEGGCAGLVQVQGEGSHVVKVLARDRSEVAEVEVDDKLIVALGDSVASGEGNPQGKRRWLDPPCHRSAAAGFEVAARRLSEVDPRRSITFVSLACSGAEVEEGLLGPYRGIVPAKGAKPYEPQVDRLERIAAARPPGKGGGPAVDAVLLSVGANDVRFEQIVRECGVWPGNCSEGRERSLRENLAALGGRYDRLDDALEGAAPGAPVLITEYFDPTRDSKGEFCSHSVGFTSQAEAQWAYEALLRPLNKEVAGAANRNGWQLVDGIADDFERHGYCAGKQRWVRRIEESVFAQHDIWGTLHPAESGHNAIAQRVVLPLADLLTFAPPAQQAEAEEGRSTLEQIGAVVGLLLLLVLLVALLWLAGRALLLLRPTWEPDPAEEKRAAPKLEVGDRSLTLRSLLLIGVGIAVVLIALVVIGGLVGRAILWLRFWSSNLPADQAVNEVSGGELVSTGSVALVIFLGLGLIAAAFAWLLDGNGSKVRATRRGLVAIGLVEVLAAVWIGDFRFDQALQLFVGLAIAALFLHFLVDEALLWSKRLREKHDPLKPPAPLGQTIWEGLKGWVKTLGGNFWQIVLQGLRLLPFLLLVVAIFFAFSAEGEDRKLLVFAPYLLAALLFAAPWGWAGAATRWRRPDEDELKTLEVPRVALAVSGLAIIVVLLVRDEPWLAGVAATAAVLGLLCLAVAAASTDRFAPYGLAVLISVPLFAGAAAFLHGVESPELQPVAAVLKGGEAVCGAYVGESDDQLWLGRLVLDERANVHRPRRGSIAPVDATRVVARSLGPLEPVDVVEARALELREQLLDARGDEDASKRTAHCTAPELQLAEPDDWQHRLADRYQPELVTDRHDGFWPVPVKTLFAVRDRRAPICRRVTDGGDGCLRLGTLGEFPWSGGEGESLEYPAADNDVDEQHDQMVAALGSANPEGTASIYYLVNREREGKGPISIQYWFFYPFNYQPVQGGLAKGGFHEGDFESIGVLLSARTHEPRYVWTARHNAEGRAFPWGDEALSHPEEHPRVFAARGSHATYENCEGQVRPTGVSGLIDDHPTCNPVRQLHLTPEATPLIDLSQVGWACWQGLFGHRNGGLGVYEGSNKFLIADAPRSPLWQQKLGGVTAEPCRGVPDPGERDGLGEEVVEEGTEEGTGVPAQLRAGAGHLENVVDSCGDWETPATSGIYMVVCNQDTLDAYVRSGLEDAGPDGVRIEGSKPSAAEGPAMVPAVRRNRTGTYLDDWRISAAGETRVSVFASCPSGKGVVAARFENVQLKPGKPLSIRDRGPGGTWLLTAPDGSPAAYAVPFPTKAKEGLLVPKPPRPEDLLACEHSR